jgi:hypothetical protein
MPSTMDTCLTARRVVKTPRHVLFTIFCYFFISFRKIQKLNDPKNKKLKAHFHKLISFSFLGPSKF